MIRITRMSNKLYGFDMGNVSDNEIMEDIRSFTDEGTPVLLVESLEDVAEFGVYGYELDVSDIIMVKKN